MACVSSLEDQLQEARKALSLLHMRLAQAASDHAVEILQLQGRLGTLEASLEASRLRETAGERDMQALRGDLNQKVAEAEVLKVGHPGVCPPKGLPRALSNLTPLYTLPLHLAQVKLAVSQSETASTAARAQESAATAEAERHMHKQVRMTGQTHPCRELCCQAHTLLKPFPLHQPIRVIFYRWKASWGPETNVPSFMRSS